MKVIFLDIDGVMVPYRNQPRMDYSLISCGLEVFSLKAMQSLTEIQEETNATIVLSSDWRHNHSQEDPNFSCEKFTNEEWLNVVFKHVQKNGFIISDVTPDLRFVGDAGPYGSGISSYIVRTMEIRAYLESHQVENYLILDDLPMSGKDLKQHAIQTKSNVGLTSEHVELAIAILNSGEKKNEKSSEDLG